MNGGIILTMQAYIGEVLTKEQNLSMTKYMNYCLIIGIPLGPTLGLITQFIDIQVII